MLSDCHDTNRLELPGKEKQMSEEKIVVEVQAEESKPQEGKRVTEELRVQAQDLYKTVNDLVRKGTTRRVMVIRKGRTLVDIPVVAGVAIGGLMAVYMAPIAALMAVGALLGGCTVRVEREEPPAQA
jgi:hypothetical protein